MDYDNIRKLREKTKLGITECKKALDMFEFLEDAEKYLLSKSSNFEDKPSKSGGIFSYIHTGNRIGTMVELSCDTDFVARTDEFQKFGKEVCLQVAAMRPTYINKADAPIEEIEKRITKEGGLMTDAKLEQWFCEVCLVEQIYIKDNRKSIKDLINELSNQVKENIKIKRFNRWEI